MSAITSRDGGLPATPWTEVSAGRAAAGETAVHGAAVRAADDPAPAALRRADDEAAAAAAVRAGAALLLVGGARLETLGRLIVALSVMEAEAGLGAGTIRLAVMASDAAGVEELFALGRQSSRVAALGFDRLALAAALGVAPERDAPALAAARGLLVLAAAAAGLPAFERAGDGPFDGVAIRLQPAEAGGTGRAISNTLSTTAKSR